MQFSNYPDFRNKVQIMLDGDDISTSDLSVAVLDLVIGSGEQRIYREVRSSTQDVPLSGVTAGNLLALPANFLELHGAPYVSTFIAAIYSPIETLQNMIQRQSGTCASSPVYYSFQSDSIIFAPAQPDGTAISGQYYKRFADLSTGLNAFFVRHPDLFLYAALVESAYFVGESERGPAWEMKYTQLAAAANEQERRRYTRGGKLQTRVG